MVFEVTAIAWYAFICGILSSLSPVFGGWRIRLMIGGVVGIVAATFLPLLQGMMGY